MQLMFRKTFVWRVIKCSLRITTNDINEGAFCCLISVLYIVHRLYASLRRTHTHTHTPEHSVNLFSCNSCNYGSSRLIYLDLKLTVLTYCLCGSLMDFLLKRSLKSVNINADKESKSSSQSSFFSLGGFWVKHAAATRLCLDSLKAKQHCQM